MTVQTDPFNKKSSLEKPLLSAITLNWEITAYISIFILAIITRFYELGARVMSHDESLHTLYSWNLYAGKGYAHDPLMHGPFLFHANALMYFLFGDNDFTARISTALAGIVLVMLPYWFRPWLGRIGALTASFMILISPGLMYYSRYIRHDAFINVWTVLMFLAFFQLMRTRATVWFYVGMAAVSLMLSTKEVAYIHGFIGVTFILLTMAWESLTLARRRLFEYSLLGIILMLGGLSIFLISQYPAPPEEAESGLGWLIEHVDMVIAITLMFVAAFFTKFSSDRKRRPVSSFALTLKTRWADLTKATIFALIIFILLHTTFFSNMGGFYSGTLGEIQYWLDQHDVQRGGQPWYYYLLMTPLYEFLPLFVGFIGCLTYLIWRKGFVSHADEEYEEEEKRLKLYRNDNIPVEQEIWPSDSGVFAGCMLYWTAGSFIIYSWAGEKMPWLTVHITLPFIFLAAHVINTTLKNFDWQKAYKQGAIIPSIATLLLIPALFALATARPFESQSLQSIEQTSKFITAGLIILLIGWVLWSYSRKMGSKLLVKTIFITTLIALSFLTIRYAVMLNFINYDYPSEPLVYAHGAPDVKVVLEQINEISRRTVGDKMIKVAYDNDSTWPLEWYMREYPNRAFYAANPNRNALDAPIVIVGAANENKVKPYLGDEYTRFNYRMVWWPIEDYKNLTLDRIWNDYFVGENSAKNRESLAKIIFYRHYDNYQLNQWPFVHRFNLYIRNDVLNDVWDYQSGPLQLTQNITLNPWQDKKTELTAVQTWGSGGQAEGQFKNPRNLAVAPDGTIYVADSGNHRIQAFDTDGTFLFQWGSEGSGPNQFNEPWGIGVGQDGRVYVTDTWNHRVQIFSADGEFLNQFGNFVNAQGDVNLQPGDFWGPRGVAIDPDGNVLISDTGNKRISKFTPDGDFINQFGGGGVVAGRFEEPVGLAADNDGNIYVADTWNERMQKFDSAYNNVTDWKVVGWGSESIFNKPFVAVDDQNRVFVSDPEGYRILVYDGTTGEGIQTWGRYGQESFAFGLPNGLAFDNDGYLLVADADNNRIMKFEITF